MASIFRQLAIGALLAAGDARAEGWQNLDAIDEEVAAAVGSGIARPVDRRIKLADCPGKLVVGAAKDGSVPVACDVLGWRMRVPLIVSGKADAGPPAIRKGDPVAVVTGTVGFSASVSGIADGEGRVGDRLRVRMGQGASFIVGRITDPGTVRVY
jgi:flagella basal body P-ring formation protein FlgA